jgi:putative ABC transport system permease protein
MTYLFQHLVDLFFYLSFLLGLAFLILTVAVLFWEKGRRGFVLALRSLWLHKLRSFLSVLGIIIGIAAVISLMAFGEGSMHDALEDIKQLGATNLIVRSVKPPDDSTTQRRTSVARYGLTYTDYDRFATIEDVTRRVPMRIFPAEVRYLERMHNGRLVATTPEYAEVNKLELAVGRFLTWDDDYNMRNVAVLGSTTADRLFPFADPLGQTVRLGTHFYRVVGVIRERMPTGGSGGSQAAEDFNNDVYMPLETCRARFGERIFVRQSGSRTGEQVELSQVTLTIMDTDKASLTHADRDKVQAAGEMVRELLRDRHLKNDWAVTVPLDLLEKAERDQNRFTMLLVLIASISLFVGGIGIMNIMLATVTERTREIGVRRALGAKRRDITLQFLIEAMVQTSLGSLVGVFFGMALVYLIPLGWEWIVGSRLPAKFNDFSFLLSLDMAFIVGMLFGWYPARRAALLDPIEALRHE